MIAAAPRPDPDRDSATMSALDTTTEPACPACERQGSFVFYEVRGVPVHHVKLVSSRAAALTCPKGDIRLHFCHACSFIWNAAFDPARVSYDTDYESTQTVSPTFNRFHERLARSLIERFDLCGKKIVEIGCGQGEFILMLAGLGGTRGHGFDPAVRGPAGDPRVRLVRDYYDERYSHLRPDFVCCKMTLEHIPDVARLLKSVRRTVADRPQAVVFFMVPEMTRILEHRAFWDIYYEHCSYFTPGALAHAFRHADFDPLELWRDYDDHYLLIAARPGAGRAPALAGEQPAAALAGTVEAFAERALEDRRRWRGALAWLRAQGRRVVLWGGGSKAVAFLSTLGISGEIDYVVDINPKRDGTFIAGTGQQIVLPAFLADYRPDVVVIMSPVYTEEIRAELARLGLAACRLLKVEAPPAALAAA